MKVKRFVAPTMQDAMIQVKLEMGKDAVIIHTRKFKEGGFFGLFGKPMIEITAAIEETQTAPKPVRASNPAPAANPVNKPKPFIPTGIDYNLEGALDRIEEKKPEIQHELSDLKNMIHQMMNQMDLQRPVGDYPPALQRYYQLLYTNEVEDKLIRKLLKKVEDSLEPQDFLDDKKIQHSLEDAIKKAMKSPKPIICKDSTRQTVVLVGPTGVGKTTTIAKLAATFSIVDKKKVALITADTYRIAAVEQLKTFGEIIGVPVDVVYTPQELSSAVQNHGDKDLVIIDTAGRSHKNEVQMAELKNFIEVVHPAEIFLVLSATTKARDMLEIIDSYGDVQIGRLIFTKLDETASCGVILNAINKTKKNLSYITTGQSVPDDIEVANPEKITRMILRERL
ncbi:MAG: flagellar biosynthesis protein FlhF [Clostridia bacterium]|nr:flagellar biosynthesis protein FlhF [Clostridia bacterium]